MLGFCLLNFLFYLGVCLFVYLFRGVCVCYLALIKQVIKQSCGARIWTVSWAFLILASSALKSIHAATPSHASTTGSKRISWTSGYKTHCSLSSTVSLPRGFIFSFCWNPKDFNQHPKMHMWKPSCKENWTCRPVGCLHGAKNLGVFQQYIACHASGMTLG